ncbi:hypothetical protein [Staphylococcus sp. 231237_7MaSpsaltlick]|uniref:hypothetical protein n=1 Tax=Staphylococcus TaxID=1279 RepID=UPI00370B27F5
MTMILISIFKYFLISFIQLMKTHENSNDIYVYRPNNDIGVMFNTNNDNVTDVHIGYGGAGG